MESLSLSLSDSVNEFRTISFIEGFILLLDRTRVGVAPPLGHGSGGW
jgi:hypothetical protein